MAPRLLWRGLGLAALLLCTLSISTSISIASAEEVAAAADDANDDDDTPEDRIPLKTDPRERTWVFLGTNLGFTSVGPASSIRESGRNGYAAHFKALVSRYTTDWVFDLGLGYQHHYASGRDEYSPFRNAQVKVKTRSGFVELSPRYRLDERWQFGAVVNGFFGTDVSFGEAVAQESNFVLAGGPRVEWETPGEKKRWRFGAQAMHDLTAPDHAVWWFMADVQFGIPIPKSRSTPAPEPLPPPIADAPAVPVRPKAPRFAEITPEKSVKIYLGEAVLRFKTASADLRPSSRKILEKVAKYLKASPNAWQKMRIDGHADKRGRLEYNMKLSRARADRVLRELTRLGVPGGKLAAQGYGPTRPIDTAEDLEAYTLNRRVELWIDGVTDPEAIVRDLNELQ
jgi:outer membrane protein OmpA-like peptidoglycan-associated protein